MADQTNNPVDSPKCPKCGGDISTVRKGHLELIRCNRCGWETFSTVFPADELQSIPPSDRMIVRVQWQQGGPTRKEALTLRKLVPALAKKPVAEFLQEAGRSNFLDLGEFPTPDAIDLREKGEENGLQVILNPADG